MSPASSIDVAVVGAGPAGSMVARELALRGAKVALIDRRHFPRSKVCGACLHPRALATLADAGLSELVPRAGGISLVRASIAARGRVLVSALERPGAVLSREAFDLALVEAALAAGAVGMFGEAARLEPAAAGAEGRVLTVGQRHLHASIVVAADGLGGGLLLRADRIERAPRRNARLGLGALLPGDAADVPAGEVRLSVGRSGYLGMARVEDGRIDVAAAVVPAALEALGPAGVLNQIAAEAGAFELRGVESVPWRGTPPLWREDAPAAGWRVFAVGDAAGYVEPFSGEGLSWALVGARALAPIAARPWSVECAREWERVRARVLAPRQRACGRIAMLVRQPRLVALLAGASVYLPRATRAAVSSAWGARVQGVPL